MTALLEYISDCSIRVYRFFYKAFKRAHVTSVDPFLRDAEMQALSMVVLCMPYTILLTHLVLPH